MKFVRPTELEKQEAYWIWDDSEEDEENVEKYDDTKSLGYGGDDRDGDGEGADDGQENTTIDIEEDGQDISCLPSSLKVYEQNLFAIYRQ